MDLNEFVEKLSGPPVLNAKQFEAIGRLALALNELEYTIDTYTPYLLGTEGPPIGFTAKTKYLRKGLLAQDILSWQTAILEALDKADKLAQKRNEYVHALVTYDFVTNQTHLKILNRASSRNEIPDPEAIINLAMEAYDLAGYLAVQCENLLAERVENTAQAW